MRWSLAWSCMGVALAVASVDPAANAVCPPQWQSTFAASDIGGAINSAVVWDDGTGPALYAAGSFTNINGVAVNRIAKYDGFRWTSLGNGLNSTVNTLLLHNDGTGTALYAIGAFSASGTGAGAITLNRVAKWNGTTWSSLGLAASNGLVGTGNVGASYAGELYVGGSLSSAGGVTVTNIARWNGSSWSAVGAGLDGIVNAMGVFTDGGQERLFVGGVFNAAGATTNLRGVARWNGTAWQTAGAGFTGATVNVESFVLHNGSIYAGGQFTGSGINSLSNVARWTGSQWVDVGGGLSGAGSAAVEVLASYNDGGGSVLFAGGSFTTAAGGTVTVNRFSYYDGTAWQPTGGANSTVFDLAPYNDGRGERLHLFGQFSTVEPSTTGLECLRIAKWTGRGTSGTSQLINSGRGVIGSFGNLITGMTSSPGASGQLYIVGSFLQVGDKRTPAGVASFDGVAWTSLGGEAFSAAPTCTQYFNGSLYVGGGFTTYGASNVGRLVRWTGTTYETAATNPNSTINALAVHNGELYAAGLFSVPTGRIGRLSGNTLQPLGTGLNNAVNDVVSWDGNLVVTGTFTTADGAPANRVARWNGSAWSAMGNGLNATGKALAVHNGQLFVAGDFTQAGTSAAARVARWDGTNWANAGGGMDAAVEDLVVMNVGGEDQLFAVGTFQTASGESASRIAQWNGCRWVAIGAGVPNNPSIGTPTVTTLGQVPDGPAAGVYVGGNFVLVGDNVGAKNLAKLSTCFACPSDLDDGSFTGIPDGGVTIDDLLFVLVLIEAGDVRADLDDGSGTGVCDGGVTVDDLIFFLDRFALGC